MLIDHVTHFNLKSIGKINDNTIIVLVITFILFAISFYIILLILSKFKDPDNSQDASMQPNRGWFFR